MEKFTRDDQAMVTDSGNIAIANKYKVAYGRSIGILTFDLGPF